VRLIGQFWTGSLAIAFRLSAAMIELQQVVSMLSDAAHQTPEAVARGRKTIEAARQLIGDVDLHPADDQGA
jgi:hypothetical protein